MIQSRNLVQNVLHVLGQDECLPQSHPVHGIQPRQSQFGQREALTLAPQHAQPGVNQMLSLDGALGIRRLHEEEHGEVGDGGEANAGP